MGFGARAAKPSSEVQAILDRTGNFETPNFRAVQALTEEERQLLLTHFREQYRMAKSSTPLSDIEHLREYGVLGETLRKRSETALAMLADPQLMDRWLHDAKEALPGSYELDMAMNSLALAAKPEVVIQLAPLILTGEPVTVVYISDTERAVSKNFTAGYAILSIIERSPAFDGQTRKWAQDQRQADGRKLMMMLPQWWKENEAHFVAKDYKAVKPGEDIYNPAVERARQWHAEYKAKEAASKAEETAAAAARTTVVASTNPAKPSNPERVGEKGVAVLPYVITGVFVLVLAGGLWLYSRTTRA
jgi:hypothetical protein